MPPIYARDSISPSDSFSALRDMLHGTTDFNPIFYRYPYGA